MILSLIQLLLHKHGKARNQATMKGTKVPNLAVVSKLFINSMPA